MPKNSLYPPGHTIHKALEELAILLQDHPEKSRDRHLQNIAVKYDLSPLEYEFLKNNVEQPKQ